MNTSHNKILIQVIRSSVMGQNIITRFSVLCDGQDRVILNSIDRLSGQTIGA